MNGQERALIRWGKELFQRRLVSGWGGNMSCRVGRDRFLITAQHAALGFLSAGDVVSIDGQGRAAKNRHPSSETPLHLAIYKGTEAGSVIHAHPPLVVAFSVGRRSFVPVSFEEKFALGEIPVLPQETPTVKDTATVVEELRLRPVVILQGHGTVAIGKDLAEAFIFTDLLEAAVQCHLFGRMMGVPDLAPSDGARAQPAAELAGPFDLFSADHMAALMASANADAEFRKLGEETDLTTSLTLRVEDGGAAWTFYFAQGRITGMDRSGEGEFVISGPRQWWETIFRQRFNPFVAMQQGRLKLEKGELWRLSHWFKPFERSFALWQAIRME